MYFKVALKHALPMLIVFLISESLGIYTDFYTNYPITDVVMHTLGGVVTAHLGWKYLGFLQRQGKLPRLPLWFALIVVVFFVFFIGVLWEWYELIRDWVQGTNFQSDVFDLLADLFFDIIGTIIYLIFARKKEVL